MSEAIRLVVIDPTMAKRGENNGKKWELWKFKSQCPDGRTHTIRTFWSTIDQYKDKEVFGTVTEEEKQMSDGTPYTSRTFQVDAAWDMAQKTAGQTPIQTPLHPGLKTGTQVLTQQQARTDNAPTKPADEKLAIVIAAYRVAAVLIGATDKTDAEMSLRVANLAGEIVKEIYAEYRHQQPEQFAPNTTPQQRSAAPAQRAATPKRMVDYADGSGEVVDGDSPIGD
jgi:hypothetical protein